MSEISYVEIDDVIEKKIVEWLGEEIYNWGCLPKYNNCYKIAAMNGNSVVGFATLGPQRLTPPLDMYCDVFIHAIEVDELFRRQGIGRHLVGMLEKWAKENGFRQIRAWTCEDMVEALHMWYALDYAMCPAVEIISGIGNPIEVVKGYRYAKIINPTAENKNSLKSVDDLPQVRHWYF